MFVLSIVRTLVTACLVATASHHVGTVRFDSRATPVVSTVNGSLQLTMTMIPIADMATFPEIAYQMDYRNISDDLLANVVVENPIPGATEYRVGSSLPGMPPQAIVGITPVYSADGGRTWDYHPVSGGGGAPPNYDANVTHVRFVMNGVLAPGDGSDVGVGFSVRIAGQ